MRRGLFKKIIPLLLSLSLAALISGCSEGDEAVLQEDGQTQDQEQSDTAMTPFTSVDSLFTINYNPQGSLDPFSDTDQFNNQLFSLMYEGLFALDSSLEPYPVLCQSYETSDGINYTLTLKEGVAMHDGGTLTAQDAAYSINEARASSKYSSRLACISSCTATGDLTVSITLYEANYRLPSLLDTPIVAYGTAGGATPPGTGPYTLSGDVMTAFSGYRETVSLETIYLSNVAWEDLAQSFSQREIDLIGYDPAGIGVLNIHAVCETRYYHTADLIFLGFNCQAGPTVSQELRQAVRALVDIDYICSNILGSSVQPSPLVLNPALDIYDADWEAGSGYSRDAFNSAIAAAGLTDSDMDGYYDTTLRFIVNEENPLKVSASRRIATDLDNMGLRVELSVLCFEAYTAALGAGNFHMYLGEVRLTADFNLSPLLSSGGSLNYGGYSDTQLDGLISAFLASPDTDSAAQAAQAL